MSAYDNDPRVRQVNEYQYTVDVGGDDWGVSCWSSTTRWYARPDLDGKLMRAAKLQTQEQTEAWVLSVQRGPFPTADETIRSLIGDPR